MQNMHTPSQKNLEPLRSHMLLLTNAYTIWDITLIWVIIWLDRSLGNRAHAARKVGISERSMRGYVAILRNMKWEIPIYDPASRKIKKPSVYRVTRNS